MTGSGRVVALSGFKDSGKTTLLEALIPRLRQRGLSVAVVKNDVHGVRVDAPGTDSDRLFRAGADVSLRGPEQVLERRRLGSPGEDSLEDVAGALTLHHDLVLVEGGKSTEFPKLWLAEGSAGVPDGIPSVLEVLPRRPEREERALARIVALLEEAWAAPDLAAGVLAGGASRRMGRSKEELEVEGVPLLERTGEILGRLGGPVVRLGGRGGPFATLPDPPDLEGPLAGMVAARRWAPFRTWVFAACDMPLLRPEASSWLLEQRRPGCWAVLPRVDGVVQPLFGVYEPMIGPALERLARSGEPSPTRLSDLPRVESPEPPASLTDTWRGANTPEEWDRLRP
ncbi:MAG: molybdopterin-guanine dinucleotide biosynthesis protein B [Thermoanaerobaculia bacterium]|nr:molybdopterin-guanine dinucleotide biosynthesis protein B [Thermoanaerobaculia bacterium]